MNSTTTFKYVDNFGSFDIITTYPARTRGTKNRILVEVIGLKRELNANRIREEELISKFPERFENSRTNPRTFAAAYLCARSSK